MFKHMQHITDFVYLRQTPKPQDKYKASYMI